MLSSDIEIVEKYLVSREYNEAITPAWLRIKAALAESTNSSHNNQHAQPKSCAFCKEHNGGVGKQICMACGGTFSEWSPAQDFVSGQI